MATYARPMQMRGRGVDGDEDHLLVLLFQRAFALWHRAKAQKSLQIIGVQFLEQIPHRVPVAGGALGLHVGIGFLVGHRIILHGV